jgi:hypothetical protein
MDFVRLIDEASRDKAFANVIAKRDEAFPTPKIRLRTPHVRHQMDS